MATSSTTVDVSSFTTDAKFRTWGSAVSAAIVAGGLTVTADTGQINWTTVTKPVATSTKAGYEIYRFNDSLQSSYPIFIRIDYGSGSVASGNSPLTWLTTGTGTDGAGNITGVGLPVQVVSSSATGTNNAAMPIRACTVDGFTLIVCGTPTVNATNISAGFWFISRTCNSSGTLTGDGYMVGYQSNTSNNVQLRSVGFKPHNLYGAFNPAVALLSNTSVSAGSVVQLHKNYIIMGSIYNTQGVLTYFTSDIAANTTFTAAPWGVTHTYIALGVAFTVGMEPASGSSWTAAFLWE